MYVAYQGRPFVPLLPSLKQRAVVVRSVIWVVVIILVVVVVVVVVGKHSGRGDGGIC